MNASEFYRLNKFLLVFLLGWLVTSCTFRQGKKIGGLVGGISQKAMDALGGESLMKARLGVELASIFGGDDRIRGMIDPMEISSSLEDDKRQEQEDYLRKLKQDELEARRRARLTP